MHLQETKTNFQTKYPPSIIKDTRIRYTRKIQISHDKQVKRKNNASIKQDKKIQKGHQNDTLHECPRKNFTQKIISKIVNEDTEKAPSKMTHENFSPRRNKRF